MNLNWLIAAAVAWSSLASAQAPQDACHEPARHAFDFWVGHWQVSRTRTGESVGESRIEPVHGGCAIRETWSQPGFSGGSLNAWDAASGKWRQTWTDSTGAWREFVGGLEGGRMVLVARTPSRRDPQRIAFVRMTFTANPDGSVRQYSDTSEDDGATWTERYDFTYRPLP